MRAARVLTLVTFLAAGAAMAEDKKAAPDDRMAHAKAMMMKDRAQMMETAKSIDAQVAQLQKQVKDLMTELSKQPKYFDEPTSSSLKP